MTDAIEGAIRYPREAVRGSRHKGVPTLSLWYAWAASLWLSTTLLFSPLLAADAGESRPTEAPGGVELVVIENASFSDPEPIRIFSVQNLLGSNTKGQPMLNIFPDQNPRHRDLVSLLNPSMPFDREETRNDIAAILASYPAVCNDTLLIGLSVGPVVFLDPTIRPNDKRRVGLVSVEGCLVKQPNECNYEVVRPLDCIDEEQQTFCYYTIADNGAFDFDVGSLKRILRSCGAAMQREISNGAQIMRGSS